MIEENKIEGFGQDFKNAVRFLESCPEISEQAIKACEKSLAGAQNPKETVIKAVHFIEWQNENQGQIDCYNATSFSLAINLPNGEKIRVGINLLMQMLQEKENENG